MARARSTIVGGGMGTAGVLRASGILTLAVVDPPTAQVASPALAFDRTTHVIMSDGVTISGTSTLTNGLVIAGNGAEYQGNSIATLTKPVIIGNGAIARGTTGAITGVTIIGGDATAIRTSLNNIVVIGSSAVYTGAGDSVLIGHGSDSNSQNTVAIGSGASISGTASGCVVVGRAATSTGIQNTAIGDAATATGGTSLTVIGGSASIIGGALRAVVIGAGATNNNFSDSVTISGTTFQANTFQVGGSTTSITTVIIGKGNTSATPASILYRVTNSVGTNIAGGNVTFQSGVSTGNASPGALLLALGKQVAGSSTTLQTVYTGLRLDNDAASVLVIMDGPSGGTDNTIVSLRQGGTQRGILGVVGAAGGLITGSAANEVAILTATVRLLFSTDGGTTLAESITAAGVHTFEKDRAIRFNNQTSAAGAAAGTLGNSPTAGNPGHWLKINIAGTNWAIPCWLG